MAKKKKSLRQEVRNRGEGRLESNDYAGNRADLRAVSRDEMLKRFQQIYDAENRRVPRAIGALDDPRSEFYAGIDPRRRQEMADAGIITEERDAMANLPRQFIQKQYPRLGFYSSPYLADSEKE